MFGYLNLNDPTKIGENESQEAKNLRLDRGYLEYQEFDIDETVNRLDKDINNLDIFLDSSEIPAGSSVSPINQQGYLKRRLTAPRADIVGTPAVPTLAEYSGGVGADKPDLSVVAHGSQIFPPGETDYVITIYNPETNEESEGARWVRTVGLNQTVQFSDFPAMSAGVPLFPTIFAEKTQAEFRIYRRPAGGAEFLRTLSDVTISAYNSNPGPYLDVTPDSELGEPCPTFNPLVVAPFYFPQDRLFSIFTVHNSRLWFKQDEKRPASPGLDSAGSVLYYSKPYIYGEIPIDNFFAFNSPIVSLHSIDEALVVVCKENVFVIYGDSDKDFVVKQATDSNIGGVGGFASASIGNALCFLASDKTDRSKGNGLFLTVGGLIRKVSFQVDKLFPVAPYESGVPFDVFGAGSVDDRFFVVRYAGGQRLVYDILSQGFLQGSDDNTFSYRSKEFGRPGLWDDMRRAFVRGVGDFKLELYYDGIKEDEIEFSIPGTMPMTEDFTVPGLRANYFSYRFIGQQNAKIFEFGRLE